MGTTTQYDIAGSAVMVTGGCGFIGSHLVRRLLDLGAERVVVVDSLRYGDVANLGNTSERIEIVRHTLGFDPSERLDEAMRGVRFLFHLAAEKHNQSKDDPIRVLRSNIEGTQALFAAAAARDVEKIVFTSSLYAYGRLAGPPFSEEEVPRPATIYGISKLCGEHLLAYQRATAGIEYNVLRYMFVYGPRQFAGMGYKSVIVNTFERLRRGEAPVVFGDGEQTLDYVYVDDAVEAAIAALRSEVDGDVFNIGSGRGIAVKDLVNLMEKVAGREPAAIHGPADWTAGSRRVAEVAKAERVLGWQARVGLEDGLRRTFEWIEQTAAAG